MNSFVWRSGEPPERSYHKKPTELALEESSDFNKKALETSGLSKSELDLYIADMVQESNRREKMNDKLNDRYMVQQTSQNPFLTEDSYLNDLQIQEQFLRPKSSHTEIKET
jgi:hypothetical protein